MTYLGNRKADPATCQIGVLEKYVGNFRHTAAFIRSALHSKGNV